MDREHEAVSLDPRDEEAPLIADILPVEAPRSHARDVHILSCGFLLIFLAYGAAQNLESSINTADNLGTTSLGILYVSFTAFSLVASLVVRTLGSRNAVILGTTGYLLFIAANSKPTWYTMVPASLYLGFSASIIWVGQEHISHPLLVVMLKIVAYMKERLLAHLLESFGGLFAGYQLIGNLISLAVLESGSTSSTNLLFIVFLCSMMLGAILLCFLRKKNDAESIPSDCSATLYSTLISRSQLVISPLFDKRMLLIIPLIAYSGLQQAFVWAEFTKDVVKPALGVSGVGGSMAVYGAFDAISSFAAGRRASGLTSITWIVSGGVSLQAGVFILLLVKHMFVADCSSFLMVCFTGDYKIICPLLLGGILGIGDGILNTQLNALLALLFKHNTEAAFAQLKVWQCAAVFFISPYITLRAMLVVMLAGIVLSLCGFLFLMLFVEKAFSSSSPDV